MFKNKTKLTRTYKYCYIIVGVTIMQAVKAVTIVNNINNLSNSSPFKKKLEPEKHSQKARIIHSPKFHPMSEPSKGTENIYMIGII